jgi:DNA modification methylase
MAKMASIHADQTTIPSDYLSSFVIHAGNNLDVLPTLPDNSVDSIVTDPPYELGFMGKKWDNSGIAYSVELWTECLRVLKPGGHLLSFGGTRTWHRVAVAIEDAGFDVRDSIAWMYGSGFPKSLDVSKAIDKNNGKEQEDVYALGRHIKQRRESLFLSRKEVNSWFGYNAGSQHWEAQEKHNARPPTQSDYVTLKEKLGLSSDFDVLIARIEAEREVIGQKIVNGAEGTAGGYANGIASIAGYDIYKKRKIDETAASTPEAQQWQGWGTALKPAFEPIVVARKPLAGKTVAANVLEHGTGALNIDGSRIGTTETWTGAKLKNPSPLTGYEGGNGLNEQTSASHSQGRWPANVILDEYSAGELDEQSGILKSGAHIKDWVIDDASTKTPSSFSGGMSGKTRSYRSPANTGGASRFFYCAKASKRDRNEGLEGLEGKAATRWPQGGIQEGSSRGAISQNFHPTVKPTNLMRYLVKLVTPPGGTVLDPFTGSGSTGKAAILEGFDFIGIEMTEEYIPIIDARLKHAEQVRDQQEQAKDEGLF